MKVIIATMMIVLIAQPSSFAEPVLTFGRPLGLVPELSSRILIKAYRQIGYELTFADLPAERSLMESNKGILDGEVNRIEEIGKKYPNLMMIPVPVNVIELVVFTKRYDFKVNGWSSLKPFSIAIRIGTKVSEIRTSGMNVAKFPTYEKAFLLLDNDRYNLCVAARMDGLEQIKKHNLLGIKALEPPLERINLYHYLHRKHKVLIPQISKILHKMQQEGILQKERDLFVSKVLGPSK